MMFLNIFVIDLKLFVLGKNAKQTYRDLVVDANYDAIDLMESTDGTGITQAVNEVINRIKQGTLQTHYIILFQFFE